MMVLRKRYWEDNDALKKRSLALLKKEQAKLAEREKLRQQLNIALRGEEIIGEKSQETPQKAEKIQKLEVKSTNFEALIAIIDLELLMLAKEMRWLEIESKHRREEDDIQVILLTMH